MRYRTKDGDLLDSICFKYYGRESAVAAVLEANPGLADKGPVFEAGIEFDLPELVTPEKDQGISLWN